MDGTQKAMRWKNSGNGQKNNPYQQLFTRSFGKDYFLIWMGSSISIPLFLLIWNHAVFAFVLAVLRQHKKGNSSRLKSEAT